MIIRHIASIVATVCGILISVGAPISAQEGARSFAARGLSPLEEAKIQDQRLALIPEEFLQEIRLGAATRQQHYDDSQYLYRIHPFAYASPLSVTGPGDLIKLGDGTVWSVHPYHRSIVKNWAKDQTVFVKPDASCFSAYRYVLHNRSNDQIIRVNYVEAQDAGYANVTHMIAGIDSVNRWIYLDDGSAWRMNPNDSSFIKWWIGDRIVVGVNNHWRTALYPNILINASVKSAPYCEANAGQ